MNLSWGTMHHFRQMQRAYPFRPEADRIAYLGAGVNPDGTIYFRPLSIDDIVAWGNRLMDDDSSPLD